MSLRALVYAYVFGGLTFIPLVIFAALFYTVYTSVPVGDSDTYKAVRVEKDELPLDTPTEEVPSASIGASELNDAPRARRGWLTMRRTFEESALDGSYVTLVRSFLDARSKDPKRSRPKDMWFAALKGTVLFLYEDEFMAECEVAVDLAAYDVRIYPEDLLDAELFVRRNAICLKPRIPPVDKTMPSLTKEMKLQDEDVDEQVEEGSNRSRKRRTPEREELVVAAKEAAQAEALSLATPWFIFVRSNIEMEDWYLSLIHASEHPLNTPTLSVLRPIFDPTDMNHLVSTLDAQPDVIPMRWLNALIGRLFFSYYRTQTFEKQIIARLMKKLAKVKRPAFLNDIVVTKVSVGNKAPTLSKPMLKELTKEGDTALEVHLQYKGEIRITVEATATINLGARFKSYTVKLVLAVVLRELEGNLLVRVKRPPSNRIWYAFTQTPKMVLDVEPIVSERQITWGMILSTIESSLRGIIEESVVMPNMDDIAFFETLPYQHRGGIWPDARRLNYDPSTMSGPSLLDAPTVNVPPQSQEVSTAPPSLLDVQPQSAEVLTVPGLSPPQPVLPVRATALSEPGTATAPTKPHARRGSWFSNIMDGEGSGGSPPREPEGIRSSATGVEGVSASATQIAPAQGNLHIDQANGSGRSTPEPPPILRRSSSPISISGEQSEGDVLTPPLSTSAPSTSAAHRKGLSSGGNTSLNASSLLATLKSRAGDKEALSKSAKEAMRKWGVNWPGSKRDSQDRQDGETPDHAVAVGAVDSRPQMESTLMHKARASYAEVRRAVAERKEKEREHGTGVYVNDSPSTPISIPNPPSGPPKALPIPNPPKATDSSPLNDVNVGGPSSSSLYARTRSDSVEVDPRNLQARSQSRASERSRSSDRGAEELADPEGSMPPAAIFTQQPSQAKTMTIPGIHASHRGEVMSMGYVPPQTPNSSEGKAKNPTIQSVYRLWKSPVSSMLPLQPSATGGMEGYTSEGQDVGNEDGNTSHDPSSSIKTDERGSTSTSTPPPSQESLPRSSADLPPVSTLETAPDRDGYIIESSVTEQEHDEEIIVDETRSNAAKSFVN